MKNKNIRIATVGGGPAALFMFKRLLNLDSKDIDITIFEKKEQFGAGMPYSRDGANEEHITNVSANEIPHIVTPIKEWVKTISSDILDLFSIESERFNEYKVLPRLFFGYYLSGQFDLLHDLAKEKGINVTLKTGSEVTDITDNPDTLEVNVEVNGSEMYTFDKVIICTGHNWPKRHEGKVPGYYGSPYPPSKLKRNFNHTVGIKGASLTAIDAIRTMARHNGTFITNDAGELTFQASEDSPDFKVIMHTRHGFLPAVRFHLEDPHLKSNSLLTEEELSAHRKENGGFLSLDYIFKKNFKEQFKDKDPDFYFKIKDMVVEEFVASMMELREELDPFQLLRAEYIQAEKSIKRRESVYWKEMLAILSFALNYPAKYLSAEDTLRLQKTLLPLISLVIAFIPQTSCRELLALHAAGRLELEAVGNQSDEQVDEQKGGVTVSYTTDSNETKSSHYKTYVDCIGQPHLNYEDFPFRSLLENKTISSAAIRFKCSIVGEKQMQDIPERVEKHADGYRLKVSGIAINDNFQVTDSYGAYNERIFIMAVPYIGGYNPDYSGLDFCEEASGRIGQWLSYELL
ncbi:FAD/NAD(P)-binding protein [Flavobacterium sp. DG1-102-2]|uniref:FAD/NAD(P)-binding protein n=1 Tax=Flavobacterium sp. DG1-102-2 TaxID=3081663 RepID=UPI00294910FE|nr:FAD/NAD(P)-binding protein [Flavobacterium sp. DG1-102-2]MDV6167152.1 FAD/NAD(P)-binding protein [Flavobacterium sp. DG1-102-2]